MKIAKWAVETSPAPDRGANPIEFVTSALMVGYVTVDYTGFLSPGTQYDYQVSALLSDGSVIRSPINSFRTLGTQVVAPATPTSLTATMSTTTSIRAQWQASAGATGYELWRSPYGQNAFKRVYRGSNTQFTDTGLTQGGVYSYKVRAYTIQNDKSYYSDNSAVVSLVLLPRAGVPSAQGLVSGKGIVVKWTAINGAAGYELYRSLAGSNEFVRVYRGQAGSFTDTGVKSGSAYTYKIRAYALAGGRSFYGGTSALRTAVALNKVDQPTFEVLAGGTIRLRWGSLTGATGYELWRAPVGSASYTRVYRGAQPTVIDRSVVSGSSYTYRVRAYKVVSDVSYYGAYSDTVSAVAIARPSAPAAQMLSTTSFNLSWPAVSGVTGYELWRSDEGSNVKLRVYRGQALKHTDSGLTAGMAYTYTLRAYVVLGNTSNYSVFSTQTKVATLSKPATPSASISTTTVTVKWAPVIGATGYELWRSDAGKDNAVRVYRGIGTSFTDSSLVRGQVVNYKIRAYKVLGTSIYSVYSNQCRVSIPLLTPQPPKAQSLKAGTGLKISWDAVKSATGYELWRSEGTSKDFTRVYRGIALTYTNTKLEPGKIYNYKLRAYVVVDGVSYYGPYCKATVLIPQKQAASPSVAMIGNDSVRLEWTALAGAGGYELWRAPAGSSAYTRVYRGQAGGFTDKGLTSRSGYTYRVRAYTVHDGVSHYGNYSPTTAVTTK